jgi:hypothetical protein
MHSSSPLLATFPAHLVRLDVIILIIFVESTGYEAILLFHSMNCCYFVYNSQELIDISEKQ